ncbi:MAG: hypothetical protein M1826_001759 [Phylliscum demangeonii]|nr:MAG: hypothetical protein M1826_001759 [Phylliscum demangeonii]
MATTDHALLPDAPHSRSRRVRGSIGRDSFEEMAAGSATVSPLARPALPSPSATPSSLTTRPSLASSPTRAPPALVPAVAVMARSTPGAGESLPRPLSGPTTATAAAAAARPRIDIWVFIQAGPMKILWHVNLRHMAQDALFAAISARVRRTNICTLDFTLTRAGTCIFASTVTRDAPRSLARVLSEARAVIERQMNAGGAGAGAGAGAGRVARGDGKHDSEKEEEEKEEEEREERFDICFDVVDGEDLPQPAAPAAATPVDDGMVTRSWDFDL